jgi:adenine-specific DNA methylase
MIPKECKRLAEVDFPIAVVSKHAMREKSIRHGHPSTLHLWWARRPLASCRAMLLALLLPDPCDEHCPEGFKDKARELLPSSVGPVGPKDEDLRAKLLKFIGDFANWDLSADQTWLSVARGLVKAAHPEEPPLVVDPFAGGGSIPLEALRVGCETFASDLNPVACLILKVMLEDIPRHGPGLADELRRVGAEINAAAEKELAEFYPADPDGARPIAYVWARTVRCEAPNCGAEIPLTRSFWLSKKHMRRRALRYMIDRPAGQPPRLMLEVFEPQTDSEIPRGTITRARATCPCCAQSLAPERVRAQLAAQRGGADVILDDTGERIGGARLLAVVTLKSGEQGRRYRLAAARDYEAVWSATKALDRLAASNLTNGLTEVPGEPLPPIGTLGFRVQRYGMTRWGDLFTARQKLAMTSIVKQLRKQATRDVTETLAAVLDRTASRCSSMSRWRYQADQEKVEDSFARQALPIVWDFAESVPISGSTASWADGVEIVSRAIEFRSAWNGEPGQVAQGDARQPGLPDVTASCWSTDPPYYDAVPYADLSDFFFVWLKRVLPNHPFLRDPADGANPLTPKDGEIVQDETKMLGNCAKDKAFFENAMAKAFGAGRRVIREDGVAGVVFAHKTTEGWEALLSGLTRGGWTITGSWPIATEMKNRLRARDSAALATSVHLVCRPRASDAPIGDWAEVLGELPRRVGDWMERLQSEGVRGADLVFACIGPALEIFSRYSTVETAEGREVRLPEYLEKVWEVVGRTALEQVLGTAEAKARNGLAGALEEDARLTALFLWTHQSTEGIAPDNGNSSATGAVEEETPDDDEEDEAPKRKPKGLTLIFDVVRRFAQPLGIRLPDWDRRIIETKKGMVRLLPVAERAKQLFGESGAVADEIELSPRAAAQLTLFPEEQPTIRGRGRRRGRATTVTAGELESSLEATTLDRVHAAMLLQDSGRSQALRNLLAAEQDRGPDFLRLANALSALYPRGSEEKRLLDAMLLAVPR